MKKIIFVALSLTLAGCVTGQYQAYQGGSGYSNEQNEDNVYTVTYTGTRTTKVEKVNDFVLLRSAELTLEKGYKYFVIAEATNSQTSSQADLGELKTMLNEGNSGSYGPGMGGGTFGGPNIPSAQSRPKSISKLVIHLFNEKPDTISYDADAIDRALKDEYQIVGPSSL